MDDKNDPFAGEWVSEDVASQMFELGIPDLHRHFGCMMLSQGSINDDMRNLLIRSAVSLVCLKRKRTTLKTDWCEGEIKTEFGSASLEMLSGIKFEGKVEVGSRTTKVTFIVTTSLLERFEAARWLHEDRDRRVELKTSYFN